MCDGLFNFLVSSPHLHPQLCPGQLSYEEDNDGRPDDSCAVSEAGLEPSQKDDDDDGRADGSRAQ